MSTRLVAGTVPYRFNGLFFVFLIESNFLNSFKYHAKFANVIIQRGEQNTKWALGWLLNTQNEHWDDYWMSIKLSWIGIPHDF